eukprot:NODE_3866_length_1970_cov_18.310906.p1 GENE.NODE_3866_length_1970_cov_18.310906~~NODE_3866_length_1970_cov_18.310906.p1  ORF type:complete len:630 (-),score=173.20 NODE_3866_length_1970_cov_18.310906:79-1968(-)
MQWVGSFYVASACFFRFLAVPVWNHIVRHSTVGPADAGPGVVQEERFDSVGFAKLAATSHMLALVAGIISCSVCARLWDPMRRRTLLVTLTLTGLFSCMMGAWLSFAFSARLDHAVATAAHFFGTEAVQRAGNVRFSVLHVAALTGHCVFFVAGVLFEQYWPSSASRPADAYNRTWEAQELQAYWSLPVLVALLLCVLVPAVWITASLGLAFLLLALRPLPYTRGECTVPPADAYKHVSWEAATKDCPKTGEQYLFVGVGWLGSRMIKRLLDRGETRIRCLEVSGANPFEGDSRVEYIQGDATKMEDLLRVMQGVDTVFSVFAMICWMHGHDFQVARAYNINVTAIENVVRACRESGVKRLVQTSTSTVAMADGLMKFDMTEDLPYVSRHANPATGQTAPAMNHYSWTKALAEQSVLAASGEEGLATVAIRPCSGIFGQGDSTLFEAFEESSFDIGPIRIIMIGPYADCVLDYVYVDNVVLGHLKAEAALREGRPGVAGEAFNIENGAPMTNRQFMILLGHVSPYMKVVPLQLPFIVRPLQSFLGIILDAFMLITRGRFEARLRRSHPVLNFHTSAGQRTMKMHATASGEKARQRLGYKPLWTVGEAVQQAWAEEISVRAAKARHGKQQ